MRNHSKNNSSRSSFYRLIAATLAMGGVSLLLPLLASAQIVPPATAAGTPIKNTATGTYEDPNAPGTPISTTSNEVTITVAEIAGITATPNGISDSTASTPVLPTDVLTYSFLITNVGNDTTNVKIPAPVLTGPGTLGTVTYEVDLANSGTFTPVADLAAAEAAVLAVNGKIKVNVPVTVALSATSGAPIKVQLGDTGLNDNSAGTQNQPVNAPTTDLRTSDAVDGTTGETAGPPVGGEKEASAIQQILVGATPQAFAAVLKTATGTLPGTNPSPNFTDDLITYGLSLRVDSAAPAGASASLTPTDLTGTAIKVTNINGGNTITTVLVSDAIPTNTVLNAVPTAVPGWTAVYSSVPIAADPLADGTWTTTPPTTPTEFDAVKRVGFVKNLAGATTATAPIAKGTTVTGFAFTVRTTGLTTNLGGSIYNIAQLFGSSVGGATVVYDESGDPNPSNFNDDGTTGPGITNGVANPATDGVDSNNNNTGTGVGGEDNVVTLAPLGAILNGPNGTPAAVGPTNNNDDFTNRSTSIAAGTLPGATINPEEITFTNTLNAPTTALTNVLVRPVAPADPLAIPDGTTATLTYGTQTATYVYSATNGFVYQSGSAIQIPNIPANSLLNYTVAIDLPVGTALSTDRITTDKGFPVPILAFSDTNGDGVLQNATEANNTTIDRVYTGFLKLIKRSQVLKGTGPDVITTPVDNSVLSDTAKTPSPGNIIRYAIEYTNISTLPVGAGNVILDASKVVITDDGTGTTTGQPNNNWGKVPPIGTGIFTSHVVGQAKDSGVGSVITFFAGATGATSVTEQTGTTQATDITKYVNTLSVPVGPGVTRTFEFQRKVN